MSTGSKHDAFPEAQNLVLQLGYMLLRFAKALDCDRDEFVRDAAVRRFEIAFDLAFQAIVLLARFEGTDLPMEDDPAINYGLSKGWFADEKLARHMLKVRTYSAAPMAGQNMLYLFWHTIRHFNTLVELHGSLVREIRKWDPLPESREEAAINRAFHGEESRTGFARCACGPHRVTWHPKSKNVFAPLPRQTRLARAGNADTLQEAAAVAELWLTETHTEEATRRHKKK